MPGSAQLPLDNDGPGLKFTFPPLGHKQWQQAAAKQLKGKALSSLTTSTHEGLTVEPVYTPEDLPSAAGYPGLPPFTRGSRALANREGWQVCQRIADPQGLLAAPEPGVHSLWLVFQGAQSARPGEEGLEVADLEGMDALLGPLDLAHTPLSLAAGGQSLALGATFLALALRRQVDFGRLTGALDLDPLATLAATGKLPGTIAASLAELPDAVAWARRQAPNLAVVAISSLAYHDAGATAVQELAYTLATGVAYLRALTKAGITPEQAAPHIRAIVAVGGDLFMEVAKLRALRRLWARVIEACGGSGAAQAIAIHAQTSARTMTVRDPWVNLLRTTQETFAAVLGGADTITTLPFDNAIGPAENRARRLAANTHTILREESNLHRVADPCGGSWYSERLSEDLAVAAWSLFQKIEAAGGMAAGLADGSIATAIATARAAKQRAVACLEDPITGVSSFPNPGEKPLHDPASAAAVAGVRSEAPRVPPGSASDQLQHLAAAAGPASGDGSLLAAAIAACSAGATVAEVVAAIKGPGSATTIAPLTLDRAAAGFEQLRQASDSRLAAVGARPRVFLALIGTPPEYRTRAAFCSHFLASGGIEVISAPGSTAEAAVEAFSASATEAAVICSPDARHDEVVPDLARALKARGAHRVLLAGRPGAQEATWRAAGVDDFVYRGCDFLASLGQLHAALGVAPRTSRAGVAPRTSRAGVGQ